MDLTVNSVRIRNQELDRSPIADRQGEEPWPGNIDFKHPRQLASSCPGCWHLHYPPDLRQKTGSLKPCELFSPISPSPHKETEFGTAVVPTHTYPLCRGFFSVPCCVHGSSPPIKAFLHWLILSALWDFSLLLHTALQSFPAFNPFSGQENEPIKDRSTGTPLNIW